MRSSRGVTLVELVVVMTIIGLVASLGATLVGRVVAGRQDTHARLTMAMAADAALARLASELQAALPNSVRVASSGGQTWVEWIPVLDAGRYRAAADTVSATPGDPLDLEDASDNGFDVIGSALAAPAGSSQLVLNNLGTPEADAYAGNNRRGGLVLSAGGRHLSFSAAGALPGGSAGRRFFIAGSPVTLACVAVGGGYELRRYSGYGWLAVQPVSSATLGGASVALVLGGLDRCSAAYSTALANIGLLTLRLALADPGGSTRLDFLQQLPVDNTP
jgi:MSHA biogenesis protein MshO